MTARAKPSEVTSEHARIKFSDLLDATQHHDGQILITRHDKPAGLLVPPYVNIPHAYDWAMAQVAWETAIRSPHYGELPADVCRAIDALGELVGCYFGHGKDQTDA